MHPVTFHPVPLSEWLQLSVKQTGFEGTRFSSYYHMNNSLPTTQWTTLTDLLWPQAVLRRIVLLMGYKEGSVCRLSALFRLWCSSLVCLALPSQHCNIQLMRGQQQRRSLTHTLTRTRKVHTSSQQGMGISTENTEHEMKTLMYTHLHTCSHKNMHTLSTMRVPYCALEKPTSSKDRSISLPLVHLLTQRVQHVNSWHL